jgi:DNA-binding NarL/FixJ family response regulator
LRPTRILLIGLPRLLAEIVTEVVGSGPDLELAGSVAATADVVRRVERLGADVAIMGFDDENLVASLLTERPRLKILALAGDSREAWLYSLGAERVRLGELSPEGLVAAVRQAAKPS